MSKREPLTLEQELEKLEEDCRKVTLAISNARTIRETVEASEIEVPRIRETFIAAIEELADRFLAELEPLKEFILPGGTAAGATLHFARTVARRAERRVVELSENEEINSQTIVYLNRLSDLLFVLARAANQRAGVPETMTDFSKRSK